MSFILGMKDGSVSTVLVIHHSNKSNQSHITISVNAEKAFDKDQQPFVIKPCVKVGIEETYLSIKTMYISAQLTSDSPVKR